MKIRLINELDAPVLNGSACRLMHRIRNDFK